MGNFSGTAFELKARIKNKSSGIDLALRANPELINALSVELKGSDISKDLITFSLQKSLRGARTYIDTSINFGSKNSIYLNYSIPRTGPRAYFKTKILIN